VVLKTSAEGQMSVVPGGKKTRKRELTKSERGSTERLKVWGELGVALAGSDRKKVKSAGP